MKVVLLTETHFKKSGKGDDDGKERGRCWVRTRGIHLYNFSSTLSYDRQHHHHHQNYHHHHHSHNDDDDIIMHLFHLKWIKYIRLEKV